MSARLSRKFSRVNALFTMCGYRDQMVGQASGMLRALLCLIGLVCAIGVFFPGEARAQSETVDWQTAGVDSLTPFPTGTTVTGSDGTTATVDWNTETNGGTFVPAFGGDFVSYFSGTIGGVAAPMLFSFDNDAYDPADRVVVTITLSRAVQDLNFTFADIDNGGFQDAIEVYYDTDLTGSFANAATDTSFWTAGSAVARTNNATFNGWRGTANVANDQTNGNLAFDFGDTQVRRIQIVYFSNNNVTGNPGTQFLVLSDLGFSEVSADLSLTKTLIGSPPVQGGTATWRLTVVSDANSQTTANGIVVADSFPSGFSFDSATGDGTFNSTNGQWSVGSLAPGASASITVTGTISSTAGSVITNTAEIIASDINDRDSTPNNGVTSEDDYASSSFTVQSGRAPGVPPVLSCPAGISTFDWDTISGWTAGSTDNTYAFASYGNARFQLSNDGAYINNSTFGGQSPTVVNTFTGGLVPAEDSLTLLANQPNQAGEVELTITLPRSFTGLQFTIFDVDFANNQFADRVEVVGLSGGASVLPTLTNGNVNTVSGNVAIGDGASNSDQALGNVVVTFTQAVDTVIVRYGNHTTAPFDPGQQGIGVHDITVCKPYTSLSVTKVSSVISDPVNGSTNPKAIPGALVEYLITVSNTGNSAADADSVVVWDDGPADVKLCLIERAGGPAIFGDPGGNSDLTYSFASLSASTDDIEFSNDSGASFNYTPIADGDGCDSAVTDFRVNPKGAFAGGATFTLTVRYIVQ